MTTIFQKHQVGRLAMRAEGEDYVAYYAPPDTMDNAFKLGSIKLRFVETQKRRDQYIAVMREAVADLIEEVIGQRPLWAAPIAAPEHER